jgi:uncharacterized protein YcbX
LSRISKSLFSPLVGRGFINFFLNTRYTSTMPQEIGTITALYRYPVKSMAGELLESSELGWQGLVGDRRLAFRRTEEKNGFPWLTASKLRELILFKPFTPDEFALEAASNLKEKR